MQDEQRGESRPTREQIVEAINASESVAQAARVLGVSRMTLNRWTRDLDIEVRKVPKAV